MLSGVREQRHFSQVEILRAILSMHLSINTFDMIQVRIYSCTRMINKGTGRYCIVGNNCVLKIPYNRSGQEQCETEARLWATEENRIYLAEILAVVNGCVIMEKLENTKSLLPTGNWENDEFQYLRDISGWNTVHIGIDKEGREKLFDYGDGANSGKRDRGRFVPSFLGVDKLRSAIAEFRRIDRRRELNGIKKIISQ